MQVINSIVWLWYLVDYHQKLKACGSVGIWHETYAIRAGAYENVYVNMPAFGMGQAGTLKPATGRRATAAGRLGR